MKKIHVFFLIVGLGLLCVVGFHMAVFMIKVVIGLAVLGFVALGIYIGRETSKHR
jgi:hypothetical protein